MAATSNGIGGVAAVLQPGRGSRSGAAMVTADEDHG